MMYCTEIETVKAARKAHQCTWCGQQIATGESYKTWRSFGDSCFVNKMHPECMDACDAECLEWNDPEYFPFNNERPAIGAAV